LLLTEAEINMHQTLYGKLFCGRKVAILEEV